MSKIYNAPAWDKHYVRKMAEWQVPLEKKRRRRERKLARDAEREPAVPEEEKLVVHNPEVGIEYPQDENGIFAVVQIRGMQFKVTKDDRLMVPQLHVDVGEQIALDEILLVGTRFYTSVGRPLVSTARVYATVEENSQSEKIIVFKMRRREGYKRNRGHRDELTVLRIDQIEHMVGEELLNNYHTLA